MIEKLIFNGNLLKLNEDHYKKNIDYAKELQNNYLNALKDDPRVGEVLIRKDGSYQRITVLNQDTVQCNGSLDHYGFFLYEDGASTFSGSCGLDLIPRNNLKATNEFEYARFWFFNVCTIEKAHQGIHFDMSVRVWKEI